MYTHFGGREEAAHERLLPRRLGTAVSPLLVAQLLRAHLRSDELAIDRFELGSISFISRVCVAIPCVLHLDRLLVQLCHFGRQRADLVALGDVVRCLPRLIALIAQATELLNLVGILSKAGRLEDDSAAPSRYSGSGFGGRGAAESARLGFAGLGQRSLARHLVPGIAADTKAPIRGDRVTRAFLTLPWHVGHLQWPSRRKFWQYGASHFAASTKRPAQTQRAAWHLASQMLQRAAWYSATRRASSRQPTRTASSRIQIAPGCYSALQASAWRPRVLYRTS